MGGLWPWRVWQAGEAATWGAVFYAQGAVALWRQSGMPASQLLLVAGPHGESGVPVAGVPTPGLRALAL